MYPQSGKNAAVKENEGSLYVLTQKELQGTLLS